MSDTLLCYLFGYVQIVQLCIILYLKVNYDAYLFHKNSFTNNTNY